MIGQGDSGLNSFGSRITLDTFNNRVFSHEVFGVSKRFTIPANSGIYVIIDPTANGVFPKNTFVLLPINIKTFGAGPVEINIHISPTYSGGTEWAAIDRNFVEPVTPHTKTLIVSSLDTIGAITPFEDIIESAAGQGNSSDVGGSVKGDLLINADKAKVYAIHIMNTDTSNAVTGRFAYNFFEV